MGREKVYSYARVPVGIIPVYYMYATITMDGCGGWLVVFVVDGCVILGVSLLVSGLENLFSPWIRTHTTSYFQLLPIHHHPLPRLQPSV